MKKLRVILMLLTLASIAGQCGILLDLETFRAVSTITIEGKKHKLGWVKTKAEIDTEPDQVYIRLAEGATKPSVDPATKERNFVFTNFSPQVSGPLFDLKEIARGSLVLPQGLYAYKVGYGSLIGKTSDAEKQPFTFHYEQERGKWTRESSEGEEREEIDAPAEEHAPTEVEKKIGATDGMPEGSEFEPTGNVTIENNTYVIGWLTMPKKIEVPQPTSEFDKIVSHKVFVRLEPGEDKPRFDEETDKRNFVHANAKITPMGMPEDGIRIKGIFQPGRLEMPAGLYSWKTEVESYWRTGDTKWDIERISHSPWVDDHYYHGPAKGWALLQQPGKWEETWSEVKPWTPSESRWKTQHTLAAVAALMVTAGIVYKTRAIPKLKRYLVGPSASESLSIVEKLADLYRREQAGEFSAEEVEEQETTLLKGMGPHVKQSIKMKARKLAFSGTLNEQVGSPA